METPDASTVRSAAQTAEWLRAAAARRSATESLGAVIEMAVRSGPCDAASITMLSGGNELESVAYSDDRVLQADRLQYELRQGPCLDAVWTDGMFIVNDLVADGRWPRWAVRAADLGIAGSVSLHLFTDVALGSLNLYSLAPRSYRNADLETAKVIAAHASVVLAYAKTERNLWQAIDARNLIGQAQGMLMAWYKITADVAFEVLRRYSQRYNVRISVVAEELTSTGVLSGLDGAFVRGCERHAATTGSGDAAGDAQGERTG